MPVPDQRPDDVPPPCPQCRSHAAVAPLREALAGGRELSRESSQRAFAAARQLRYEQRQGPAPPSGPKEAYGDGDNGPPSAGDMLMDLAAAAVGGMWRRTVAKKFSERVVPAMDSRMSGGFDALVAGLDESPRLWCCRGEHLVLRRADVMPFRWPTRSLSGAGRARQADNQADR